MATEHITGGDSLRVKPVDCSTCTALCCRKGTRIRLSPTEVAFMGGEAATTEVAAPKRRLLPLLPRTNGTYELKQDCVHLAESPTGAAPLCDAHQDPLRPDACGAFESGGLRCRRTRYEAGIDTAAEFLAYEAVTSQDPALLQAVVEAIYPQQADIQPPAAA